MRRFLPLPCLSANAVRIIAPVRNGVKPIYGQGCRGVSLTAPFRTGAWKSPQDQKGRHDRLGRHWEKNRFYLRRVAA